MKTFTKGKHHSVVPYGIQEMRCRMALRIKDDRSVFDAAVYLKRFHVPIDVAVKTLATR